MADSPYVSSSSAYGSPRVVLKVPDISAGLNHSTISVSDSDPCSPVGTIYKDITKTLTPKNHFIRPVKQVKPSETVMRKVNLLSSDDSKRENVEYKENTEYRRIHNVELNSQSTLHAQNKVPAASTSFAEYNRQKYLKEHVIRNSPLTFYSAPNYGPGPLYQSNVLETSPEGNHRFIYPTSSMLCVPDNELKFAKEKSPRPLQTPSLITDESVFNFANVVPQPNSTASPFVSSSGYRSAEMMSPENASTLTADSQGSHVHGKGHEPHLNRLTQQYSDISSDDEPVRKKTVHKGDGMKTQQTDKNTKGKTKKRRKIARNKKQSPISSPATSGKLSNVKLARADTHGCSELIINQQSATPNVYISNSPQSSYDTTTPCPETHNPVSYQHILPNRYMQNEVISNACVRLHSNTIVPLNQLTPTFQANQLQQYVTAIPNMQSILPTVAPVQNAQNVQLCNGQYVLAPYTQPLYPPISVQNNVLQLFSVNTMQSNVIASGSSSTAVPCTIGAATPVTENLERNLDQTQPIVTQIQPTMSSMQSSITGPSGIVESLPSYSTSVPPSQQIAQTGSHEQSTPPIPYSSSIQSSQISTQADVVGKCRLSIPARPNRASTADSLKPPPTQQKMVSLLPKRNIQQDEPKIIDLTNEKERKDETETVIDLGEEFLLEPPKINMSTINLLRSDPNFRSVDDIKCLQIGQFKYLHNIDTQFAKMKINFSKSLLTYELELIRSPEDREQLKCPFGLIEVHFASICGLGVRNSSTIIIEVDSAPSMYLGYRLCDSEGNLVPNQNGVYNRRRTADLTRGQLATCAFHQVTFRANIALRCLMELAKRRQKFAQLLLQPLSFNHDKPIQSKDKAIFEAVDMKTYFMEHLRDVAETEEVKRGSHKTLHVCACVHGCHLSRCGCVVREAPCKEQCKCVRRANCQNPLNTLHNMGFRLAQCYGDACFLNMIYTVKHLGKVLVERVVYPCCNHEVVMSETVPGLKPCPNCGPKRSYRYSWCLGRLLDEETEKRRHCVPCRKCAGPNFYHCKIINRCHPIGFEACPCYGMARKTALQDFEKGKIHKISKADITNSVTIQPMGEVFPGINPRSITSSTHTSTSAGQKIQQRNTDSGFQSAFKATLPTAVAEECPMRRQHANDRSSNPVVGSFIANNTLSAFTPTKPCVTRPTFETTSKGGGDLNKDAGDGTHNVSTANRAKCLESKFTGLVGQPLLLSCLTTDMLPSTLAHNDQPQTMSQGHIKHKDPPETPSLEQFPRLVNQAKTDFIISNDPSNHVCSGDSGTVNDHINNESDTESYLPLIDEDGFPGLTGFNNQVLAQQLEMLPDLPAFTERTAGTAFDLGKPLYESSPMPKC